MDSPDLCSKRRSRRLIDKSISSEKDTEKSPGFIITLDSIKICEGNNWNVTPLPPFNYIIILNLKTLFPNCANSFKLIDLLAHCFCFAILTLFFLNVLSLCCIIKFYISLFLVILDCYEAIPFLIKQSFCVLCEWGTHDSS